MGQKNEHQLSANSPKSPPQEQHLLTHLSPPKLCSTQGSGRKGSNLYTLLRSSHPKPQEHHPTGSKSPAAPEMHRVRQRETKAPTDDMGKPQQCVSTPHPTLHSPPLPQASLGGGQQDSPCQEGPNPLISCSGSSVDPPGCRPKRRDNRFTRVSELQLCPQPCPAGPSAQLPNKPLEIGQGLM